MCLSVRFTNGSKMRTALTPRYPNLLRTIHKPEQRGVHAPDKMERAASDRSGVLTVQDLLFDGPGARRVKVAQVAQDVLGGFRLARSRLSRHDDGLGLLHGLHVAEGLIGWNIKMSIGNKTLVNPVILVRY